MRKYASGVMILILLVNFLVGCGQSSYKDGNFIGEAKGHNGTLKVSVTVEEGEISNVEITQHEESEDISDPAIKEIPNRIVENNSVDVDSVSGATNTSQAIKDAVQDALSD